jgi:hypothetical protein
MLKIPKTVFLFMVLIAVASLGVEAYAELYQGIGPLDTLADLKKKYPNATFTKTNPAWAKETDVMYRITGQGISGTIIVKFYDSRPYYLKIFQEADSQERRSYFAKLATQEDDTVMVDWVRWLPDTPFPVERLITKHGKPDTSGFADDDYHPYKEWTRKGIYVRLTDDGKKVFAIDFTPTKKEVEAAIQRMIEKQPK